MSLQRIEAIVLRTTRYSETSIIAALYSRQLGRTAVIAKGARKPGNKTAQALQATHTISCIRYQGRSSDIKTVSQVELIADRPEIAESPLLLGVAARGLELVLYQTPPEEPSPSVYHLLHDFLGVLNGIPKGSARSLLLAFELRLQRILGYGFTMGRCSRCGKSVSGFPLLLSAVAGGVLCPRCGEGEDVLVRIERSDYSFLDHLLQAPFSTWVKSRVDERRIAGIDTFVERVWRYHSPGHKESASLLYLSDIEGNRYQNEKTHHVYTAIKPIGNYSSSSPTSNNGDARQ